MKHGSLFSGIGGFDLAAEWMGWENVFHCEWNPFGQKVLHHYWPNSEQFTDITKSDFTKYANKIDILTGGFPCQPYSTAGKRLGKEDERHLWPEMLRAIREIQPRWIVGENVRGLTNWNGGVVFDEVQSDLEAQGYEVTPFLLPACAVNAPHRRDRIWFVAYSKSSRSTICKLGESEAKQQIQTRSDFDGFESMGDVTDTKCVRLEYTKKAGNIRESKTKTQRKGSKPSESFKANGINGDVADTLHSGLQGGQKINRWEEFNSEWTGYGNNLRTISENNSRYSKCNFKNFPTVSPICNGDDGLSDRLDSITFPKWRNESIKAGGNAIVPQVVYQIFKSIEQYERIRTTNEDQRQTN